MNIKRNLFFPAILLFVIVGMTAIAAPVIMQKYGDLQAWSQKSISGSTTVPRKLASGGLPDTGLQGQVAEAATSNCTYHYGYWKDNPELWPNSLAIGQLTYTKGQAARLFGTNAGIDPATAAQNPIQYLELEAYITSLNIKQGASPYEIQQTLTEATTWLAQYRSTPNSSVFDSSIGFTLGQNLEDYNNGITGPGSCANQPLLPKITPTPSNLPSPVPTLTPSPSKSQTNNQQAQPDQKQSNQVPPTTLPPATNTPQPTATPLPPTATPLPTNTPRPTKEPPLPPGDPQPPPDKPKPPGKPPKPPGKPPKPKPTKIPKDGGYSQVFPTLFG